MPVRKVAPKIKSATSAIRTEPTIRLTVLSELTFISCAIAYQPRLVLTFLSRFDESADHTDLKIKNPWPQQSYLQPLLHGPQMSSCMLLLSSAANSVRIQRATKQGCVHLEGTVLNSRSIPHDPGLIVARIGLR